MSQFQVSSSNGGTVSGGQVSIPSGGGSWTNYLKRDAQIEDGQGIEVTFTPSAANNTGIIYLGNGQAMYSSPGPADLRRWGLYWTGGTFYRDYAYGTNPANDLSLGVAVQANTSYTVRLEADGTGNYQLKLWQTSSPANILASRSELPPGGNWSGQQYSAIIFALNGNLSVQEYREIPVMYS